jgi:hypothetical protein
MSLDWEKTSRLKKKVSVLAQRLRSLFAPKIWSLLESTKMDQLDKYKKKCLPTEPGDNNFDIKIAYYIVAPFSQSQIAWGSFENDTMSNLIVDLEGKLWQLITGTSPEKLVNFPNRIMIVAEYRKKSGNKQENQEVLARKFLVYSE